MAQRASSSLQAHASSEHGGVAPAVGPTLQALYDGGRLVVDRILGLGGAQPASNDGEHRPLELCRRTADLFANPPHGVQHWWLRGDGFESGMGKRGGGVPGHGGPEPYTMHTTLNDHRGEGALPDATCVPVGEVDPHWDHVDEDCVRGEMEVGRDTGLWVPPVNDCHEVVKNALDRCRIAGEPGAEVLPLGLERPDAGTVQP